MTWITPSGMRANFWTRKDLSSDIGPSVSRASGGDKARIKRLIEARRFAWNVSAGAVRVRAIHRVPNRQHRAWKIKSPDPALITTQNRSFFVSVAVSMLLRPLEVP